jgi:hypothetical protein
MYYVIADNGVIKYCKDGDTSWTTAAGGAANFVTTTGTVTTFERANDKVLILNGVDNLGYLDLTNMSVVHFTQVPDPTSAPTSAYVGTVATGSYNIYYCIAYNTVIGKTVSSPIVTVPVNKIREQWASAGTDGLTLTDPNTRPAGAVSWNLYISDAPSGSTIQLADMLPLAIKLDISTKTFTDNGKITPMTNNDTAPTVNSTKGPKAQYAANINGRLFLYGITDDPYAVMIGGGADHALDFTEAGGGYRLILNQGTDFFPKAIIGFRNGQAVPSITVIYSSVSGLSKASIIDQSTVSLGNFSAVVWGSVDQNYGAAGIGSPYAVTNYRGMLIFPSTDGFTSIDTSKLRFNVLTATRISDRVIDEVGGIKSDLYGNIVGTAWANHVMFSVPSLGFNYNNEILIYDVTIPDAPIWYVWDIRSQWIGTISPPGSAGFVYITQDNHFFKLQQTPVAQDDLPTVGTAPFSFQVTSGLIGADGTHNSYLAAVQAVFYLRNFTGSMDLTATWRDYQSGRMKSKTKTVYGGSLHPSSDGGWSSTGYEFNLNVATTVNTWGDVAAPSGASTAQAISKPFPVKLSNVVSNEFQATVATTADASGVTVRSVAFEGQPLGISPDAK